MNQRIVTLDAVTLAGKDWGRRLVKGETVDLDEVLGGGVTLGEALGDLAATFTPVETPAPVVPDNVKSTRRSV